MKLLIFFVGLCIGSFVNVVVYRLPRNINYVLGRSMCTSCCHTLSCFDLIPILSYVFLKGKCRYCLSKISFRYPLIEFFMGIMFILLYNIYDISLSFIVYSIIVIVLLIISIIDIDFMIIPDEMLIIYLCLLIPMMYMNNISIIDRIIGFFIISLPMFVCNCFKECFGHGDIKLISILGLLFGYNRVLIIMYIAFLLGGIYSVFIVCMGNKDKYIPFAPFISLGTLIIILFNTSIINMFHYCFFI